MSQIPQTIIDAAKDASVKEVSKLISGFSKEDREFTLKLAEDISLEALAAALAATQEERDTHVRRLASYRNAMGYMEGVAALRTYNAIINITGDVLAATIKALVRSAL